MSTSKKAPQESQRYSNIGMQISSKNDAPGEYADILCPV
jgi:hypothetical protein